MNIKEMKLPQVILILGLVGAVLGTVIVLTLNNRDAAAVYAFGGTLLLGLGVVAGVGGQVASNTNGNTTRQLDMLAEAMRVMAQASTNNAQLLAMMTPSSPQTEKRIIDMANVLTAPPLAATGLALAEEPISPPRPPEAGETTVDLPVYGSVR